MVYYNMEIIEEGVVIEKGVRGGVVLGNIMEAITSWGGYMTEPEKGYYWAKIKVPSLNEPLLMESKYNFKKGAFVRVKYNLRNIKGAKIVVDWK